MLSGGSKNQNRFKISKSVQDIKIGLRLQKTKSVQENEIGSRKRNRFKKTKSVQEGPYRGGGHDVRTYGNCY